jgi:hypothetical protein
MKKILVTVASLAIAIAANFGIASAHPFRDPTSSSEPTPSVDQNAAVASTDDPIVGEVQQQGDQQTSDMTISGVQGVQITEQTQADEDTENEDHDDADDAEDDDD